MLKQANCRKAEASRQLTVLYSAESVNLYDVAVNNLECTDVYRGRSLNLIYALAGNEITVGCEIHCTVRTLEILCGSDFIAHCHAVSGISSVESAGDDVCCVIAVGRE